MKFDCFTRRISLYITTAACPKLKSATVGYIPVAYVSEMWHLPRSAVIQSGVFTE